MRKKATIAQEEESTINMTPMLDVVFIMLIFFIVTSSFVKESGISVIKPEAETAEQKIRTSLLIAINRKDDVWIARKKVDKPAVKAVVQKLYGENPKGAVVIQADRESSSETVLFVMEAAREVGVQDIAVAALED